MARRFAAALLALAAPAAAKEWAVLVAGSNGFYNYRHQADVCHAYQLLLSRGFDKDRIITMMYDDVANNTANPFKGKLFNYPWKTMDEATDVYGGCRIDYKEKEVTPEKFLAVLTGDAEVAGGPVLRSGPRDHVFVNFVDHGAVGLIAFPDSNGEQVLHAKDLVAALKVMYHKGMYQQLVFYLETCESGSMFQGLLPWMLPVYAVTAANAHESSWGTFCGDEAHVAGVDVGTCLGDLFSVNWMMDSEGNAHTRETLGVQFDKVKALTNKSHVMRYGQWPWFNHESISDFQGEGGKALGSGAAPFDSALARASAVDSRQVKLEYLRRRFAQTGSEEDARELQAEIRALEDALSLREALSWEATQGAALRALPSNFTWTPEMLDCHAAAVTAFGSSCGWSEAHLPLSKTLYQLCEHKSGSAEPIVDIIEKVCPEQRQPSEIWA